MKPEEFTEIKDKRPSPHKWIIVSDNITDVDRFGEMIHVWLSNGKIVNLKKDFGFCVDVGQKWATNVTHWKYA